MDYSLLTEQQIQKRFYFLPENIKDVLNSEKNTEIVRQVCRSHYLDEEKTLIVEQLTGLTLLGFVSPDEIRQEISENAHVNPKHSDDIAREIDRKIFALVRTDLEKIYQPAVAEAVADKPAIEEEALDLRGKVPVVEEAKPQEAEAPKIIQAEKKELEKVQLSKIKPQFGEVELPKIEEAPMPIKEVEPPKISTEETGPLIIHKEAEFKPLAGAKKSLGGLFGLLKRKEEGEKRKEEAAKAQVEIGGLVKEEREEKREISKAQEASKVRVVHYTQFEPAVSPFPAEERKEEEEKKEAKPQASPHVAVEEKIEEKPKAEPLDLRKPPAGPAKPEEEAIDLGAFK